MGSTNSQVPAIPRVGTGAAWTWGGGAFAVLVSFPIQHPMVGRTIAMKGIQCVVFSISIRKEDKDYYANCSYRIIARTYPGQER